MTKGKFVSSLLDLVFPFGGSVKCKVLSTILIDPLCNLASTPPVWVVAAIPNWPLLTLTDGKVAIPEYTSIASLIVPVGVLENPTSVTFTYSSSIF